MQQYILCKPQKQKILWPSLCTRPCADPLSSTCLSHGGQGLVYWSPGQRKIVFGLWLVASALLYGGRAGLQRNGKGVPGKVRSQQSEKPTGARSCGRAFTYLANLRKPALLKSLIPFTCYFMWAPRKTSDKRLGFFPVSFRVNARVISGNPRSLPSSTFSLCYV